MPKVKSLHCILGILVVATGTLGITAHSRVRDAVETRIDIHVLLTMLLCSLVVCRFLAWVNSVAMHPSEIRTVSRQLSRLVYLLLYLIIGLRIVVCVMDCSIHGIAFDFMMIEPAPRGGGATGSFDSRDDFQALLACGLAALMMIRILALTIHGLGGWQRMRRRNPVARPYPRHPWRVSVASSDIAGRFPEH
jgi:cytochrome b561